MALRALDVEVAAITTVAGNVPVVQATRNALLVTIVAHALNQLPQQLRLLLYGHYRASSGRFRSRKKPPSLAVRKSRIVPGVQHNHEMGCYTRKRLHMQFRFLVIVLATLAVSAQNVNFYSREKEAALGAALAKEIGQRTTPIESSAVRDYIASLGRQLASQLPDTGLTWTFIPVFGYLTDRTHEPTALPGGFIFVAASLMQEARNEAEFAGMLAQAMAHVSERHGTRMATSAENANASTIPLLFMGAWPGVGDRDHLLVPFGFLDLRLTFEIAADRLAVRMMEGAGYDPSALLRYIDRAQPSRDERIAALEQAIQALPPATYSSPNEEFQRIQEEVRRLMPVQTDEPTRDRRPPSLLHP
jgi:hypothetical protein